MKNDSLLNNNLHRKNRDNLALYIFLVLLGLFLTTVAGLLVAFGNMTFILIFLGLIVGIIFITLPRLSLWIILIGGTVVSGLAELYLPSLQQIRWGIALLSIAMIPISLVSSLFAPKKVYQTKIANGNQFFFALIIFICISIISTLVNGNGVVGLKNYFQLFGFSFGIAIFCRTPEDSCSLMKFILLLAIIQLPFVLHQFIFLVPLRSTVELALKNVVAVDIVDGTFGGEMFNGGKSSVLVFLSAISIILILAKWYVGQVKLSKMLQYFIIAFFPMLLCEGKVFIVFFLIGLVSLFWKEILINPVRAIAIGLICIGLNLGVIVSITFLPGAKSQQVSSVGDLLDNSLAYNAGNKGYGSLVLNRTSVYSFWWSRNIEHGNMINALIGYGPGCANEASTNEKTLSKTLYKGYGIGLTAFACLLWEIGILGALSVLFSFALLYRFADRLQVYWQKTKYWPYVKTAQIGVVLALVSLFHNNYFTFDIGFQTLFTLLVGYLIVMSHFSLGDIP